MYKKLTAHYGIDNRIDGGTRVQQQVWRQGERLDFRVADCNQNSDVSEK